MVFDDPAASHFERFTWVAGFGADLEINAAATGDYVDLKPN